MEQENGGKRAGRRKTRRSDKNDSRVERTRSSRWYRRPIIIIPLLMAFVVSGSVAAVLAVTSESAGTEASQDVTAESGGDVDEAPAETPLASASEQIVASMSLEQKIGQMMMVGFQSSGPDAGITAAIKERHIGGVILFARNIVDQGQVAGMNDALQKIAAEAGHPVKLMISTDQEGGATRRFEDIGPYYSEPMIGEMSDAAPAAAQQQAASAARDLKRVGINTNLAPVIDVSSGWGSVMDVRSFGSDAEWVAELSAKAVKGYNNATVISCAKHFPGHGSADGDSEEYLPTVESDATTIQGTDLLPFAAVIKEDVPMIMTGHLAVPALDPSGSPASLSKIMVTELLRGVMGFTGVVITDDLEMGAITENYSIADAAVAAVASGNDIILVGHTAEAQVEAYDALIAAVHSGKLSEEDIDRSVVRIIDMKKKFRLEM